MEFFKQNTNINFMAQRKGAAIVSTILFVLSIVSFGIFGLNWGLDFTGGAQIQLNFPSEANLNQIRDALQTSGFKEAQVMNYGTSKDVLVKVPASANMQGEVDKETIIKQIAQVLPDAKVQQVDYIGPQVGQELATKGALAIVVALIGTMIYIALRFDLRFAVGSTVALIHDPVLILGIFSFFHIEFNLIALAAV
ncbi:MAG: protein translocase subunit SecF, partial [Gammaproteobacteria bacterium]|nr:protein translocase subunit SecF [Gammaproteobacteria bacterium]